MFLYGDDVSLSGNTGETKKDAPGPEGPGTSFTVHWDCGVVGSMPDCHSGDPGSIPSTPRTLFSLCFQCFIIAGVCNKDFLNEECPMWASNQVQQKSFLQSGFDAGSFQDDGF